VVIHYTAGSEGPTSAESGAAYDKTRVDGTSTHAFADSNSVVVEVPDSDRAHAARMHGNEIGIQMEICGTAQTRTQWLDAVSLPTLRLAARWTAEKCALYGLPVRRLSVGETRAAYYGTVKPKGIVGHVDCTNAYPEDGGDHTDPGAAFPWDVFLNLVSEELSKLDPKEDDMAKMFIVTDSTPPDKVCISGGGVRRWLATSAELNAAMAAWGLAFPTERVTLAQADARYGPDVATLRVPGPPGPQGEPGTDGASILVPHNHTFDGATGAAIVTPVEA
jgi:hypothetical protein